MKEWAKVQLPPVFVLGRFVLLSGRETCPSSAASEDAAY